jgi:hypothetical protein
MITVVLPELGYLLRNIQSSVAFPSSAQYFPSFGDLGFGVSGVDIIEHVTRRVNFFTLSFHSFSIDQNCRWLRLCSRAKGLELKVELKAKDSVASLRKRSTTRSTAGRTLASAKCRTQHVVF